MKGRAKHEHEKMKNPNLNGVLDLVREVLQRADGNALFGRIARGAIALGHEGHNHLAPERETKEDKHIDKEKQ